MTEKSKIVLLGLLFLVCLMLAYFENILFFNSLDDVFATSWIAVPVVFFHNVFAVSLIMLGMTLYVKFVLAFLLQRRYEYVILQYPRLFAFIFTLVILAVSVLRANTLLHAQLLQNLMLVILFSLPQGILEAYAIFLVIEKVLKRNLTLKNIVSVLYLSPSSYPRSKLHTPTSPRIKTSQKTRSKISGMAGPRGLIPRRV